MSRLRQLPALETARQGAKTPTGHSDHQEQAAGQEKEVVQEEQEEQEEMVQEEEEGEEMVEEEEEEEQWWVDVLAVTQTAPVTTLSTSWPTLAKTRQTLIFGKTINILKIK